ncbi:hypothetical protein [Salipiger sp. PrR003]|uniref:hypothetical protein n=1 Tax=Salipiger sp. PrR003 TaxID=2706776 RepID=UPI0013DC1AF1|nr:hypothetical protein [Salipiger sp. PrR003]NDV50176.1 hypothetical protein [Salipiger sp. PrR003]
MRKPGVRKHSRRRFDNARMKRRARAVRPWDTQATNADHLAECPCHMCGNPRRHWGQLTMPELKFRDMAEFQIKDIA